jgi:hypothetical protein
VDVAQEHKDQIKGVIRGLLSHYTNEDALEMSLRDIGAGFSSHEGINLRDRLEMLLGWLE